MKRFSSILIVMTLLLACRENKKTSEPIPDFNWPDTTNVIVKWDDLTYVMTKATAWVRNNELSIDIAEVNGYSFYFDFQNTANKWSISSISQPSPKDCLFVSSRFRVLDQTINLNRSAYNIGDRIAGNIDLLVLGKKPMVRELLVPFVDKRKWDTIYIKGHFSSLVD